MSRITLPYNLTKEKLTEFIEQTFNREGSQYLPFMRIMPFLLPENQNDISCGHVRKCMKLYIIFGQVIDKGCFSETFLFKHRGGRSPPSGLNRKPRKNPLLCL